MRIASVGSGSRGNGTLVMRGDTLLLVDCGFSHTQLIKRMEVLGCHPKDMSAVLVTHEHADHIGGVAALANKYQMPVFLTRGSAQALKDVNDDSVLHFITPDIPFHIGGIDVVPFSVPHDANEPVQYMFSVGRHRVGILTDLGHVPEHIQASFGDCDQLLLEFNHDQQLLADGPYELFLKARIGGDNGHLNNHQAMGLLETANLDRLQHLVVGHVSQQNNDISKIKKLLKDHFQKHRAEVAVTYATQNEGCHWLGCC